jgi:catechol 2,3-dioxygenase-like lactoylglutathione lyase family enzyme
MIDSVSRATIIAAEPQLYVTDIAAAIDFYVGQLGFALAFTHGEPAFYAQVVRDGARINLRASDGPIGFRANEPDALSATLTVNDTAALFREFEQAGATFHQLLRSEPWGARTFIVADPDGNLLCFAGSA